MIYWYIGKTHVLWNGHPHQCITDCTSKLINLYHTLFYFSILIRTQSCNRSWSLYKVNYILRKHRYMFVWFFAWIFKLNLHTLVQYILFKCWCPVISQELSEWMLVSCFYFCLRICLCHLYVYFSFWGLVNYCRRFCRGANSADK